MGRWIGPVVRAYTMARPLGRRQHITPGSPFAVHKIKRKRLVVVRAEGARLHVHAAHGRGGIALDLEKQLNAVCSRGRKTKNNKRAAGG